MDTVTLRIDGREVTVAKGTTILHAALDNGVPVPYYCYHPGLGVGGSCRVCLVKVEKMPKLQTSCSTVCTDGMVVETSSRDVVDARASVFEFLLVNHPLDCPVCDKGGECPLQDFSSAFGPSRSRMEFQRRTFDGCGATADVDFGPTLMLNRNRCILCTRCVRFMRDVDGDAQIGITDRGYGSGISTFEEHGVHSLLSGNLMDVCPVGAITTRDYRLKSRPWDNPVAVDTICTSCAKGCNTTIWLKARPEWAKGAHVVRVTPRFNREVNGYWMCDIGRFGYHWVEGDQRLTTPLVRTNAGTHAASTWMGALARLREALGPLVQFQASALRMLVSAHASLEELFLVRELARAIQGPGAEQRVCLMWRTTEKTQPAGTAFTVLPVDAPNVVGARDLGFVVPDGDAALPDPAALQLAIGSGAVGALYVIDPGPAGSLGEVSWIAAARASGKLPYLVVQAVAGSALTAVADIVLPGAAWTEKDATFTNCQGIVQSTARVMAPPGDAREDWQIVLDVAAGMGVCVAWTNPSAIRAEVARVLAHKSAYAALAGGWLSRPVADRKRLHASNPSERWKWDHVFRDLPPIKGEPVMLLGELAQLVLKK